MNPVNLLPKTRRHAWQVSEKAVLQQQAFLLFYTRRTPVQSVSCPPAAATPEGQATPAVPAASGKKRPAATSKPSPRNLFADGHATHNGPQAVPNTAAGRSPFR